MYPAPPPIGALPTPPLLELLDGSNTVLFSAPVFQERSGSYGLNLETFSAYGAEGQNVKGDGRVLIGEHTFFVLLKADQPLPVKRKAVLDALKACAKLRIGMRTQEAKGLRIASETPWGRVDSKFGLVFAPLSATSTDGTTEGSGL